MIVLIFNILLHIAPIFFNLLILNQVKFLFQEYQNNLIIHITFGCFSPQIKNRNMLYTKTGMNSYKIQAKTNSFFDMTNKNEGNHNKSIKRNKQGCSSKSILGMSPQLEKIKPKTIKSHKKENQVQNNFRKNGQSTNLIKKTFSQKNTFLHQKNKKQQVFKAEPIQNILSMKVSTQQKTQKDKGYLIKKRIFRNTTCFNKEKNQSSSKKIIKNQISFIRKQTSTLYEKAQQNQKKLQINYQKKYYIDDLKRQFKKLIKNQGSPSQMIITHFLQSVTTFHTYKNIVPPQNPHLKVVLPINKKDITLIFDMDQTLLHAQNYDEEIHQQSENCWGENMDILLDDKSAVKINLKIRPFAQEVLKRLKQKFQIGLFTAGNQIYAKQVLKKLDYKSELFDFLLFRQHCHMQNQKLNIKDLRILSNRDIKKIVLIDNSPHTYLYSPQNGVPISSFYDDQLDTQLLKLQNFLQKLHKKVDVQEFLKNYFKISKYKHYLNAQELIEDLYGELK